MSDALDAAKPAGRPLTDDCADLGHVKTSHRVVAATAVVKLCFSTTWLYSYIRSGTCILLTIPHFHVSIQTETRWKKGSDEFLHPPLFAIVQGVCGGQPPVRSRLPPASEGLFFRGTTSGQRRLPRRAVAWRQAGKKRNISKCTTK